MAAAYSQDLRWRAIWLTEIVGIDVEKVSFYLQISSETLNRWIQKCVNLGNVSADIIDRPCYCINALYINTHLKNS